MRQQFRARVSLLTDSKLKANFDKHKTDDKEIDDVGCAILELMTQDVDPSAKITLEEVV